MKRKEIKFKCDCNNLLPIGDFIYTPIQPGPESSKEITKLSILRKIYGRLPNLFKETLFRVNLGKFSVKPLLQGQRHVVNLHA